jgi:hypothetical protein
MFLADVCGGGTLTNGCVAAGRPGGCLHVDGNGAVSPCVFVPFAPVNVHDVYARGGTLDDVWKEPFFAAIRRWQRSYGYREKGQPAGQVSNWLMPCPMRDHHHEFRQMLAAHPAAPTSDEARAARDDPEYHGGLEALARELATLADPIWTSRYAGTRGGRGRVEHTAAP